MTQRSSVESAPSPRPAGTVAPWGLTEITVALLAGIVLLGLVALALAPFTPAPAGTSSPGSVLAQIIGQMVLDIAIVGVAAFLSLGRYRRPARDWGLRRERPLQVVAVVGAAAGAFVIMVGYVSLVRAAGWSALEPEPNVPSRLFDHAVVLPFTALLLVLVAPFAEEMFFRGFMFTGLRRSVGVPLAALTSGLVWSVIHGQAGLVLPITGIGVLFALVLAATGSLWNAIAAHAIFNLVSMVATVTSR